MRRFAFLIFLFASAKISFGQAGTENYLLKNIGYISIPTNMELQNSSKTDASYYAKEAVRSSGFNASENRVVFKEKGANNDEKNEYSTYARVILKTTIGSQGDFEKLTSNLSETASDLSKLDNQLRSEIEQSFIGTGVKLLNWNGVKIVPVNGRTALNISYLRQLNDQPPVVVSIYQFNNNDRIHKLTLSYIRQDSAKWEPAFSKVLTSFTITNIR